MTAAPQLAAADPEAACAAVRLEIRQLVAAIAASVAGAAAVIGGVSGASAFGA